MARKKRRTAKPSAPRARAEIQFPPGALRLAVPALVALFSLFAWSQRGVYEDGFFYLRVADVFLHSGELAYNPGERYETNTDFLWTLLLIPGPAAGVDDILWMHLVGVAVFAAALWATFSLARRLFSGAEAGLIALVLLGGHYSFVHFATTGFAPALQALAAVCCLLALLRFGENPALRSGALLGCALLFLALCRLDSAVFGLPLVLCAVWLAWRGGKSALPGIALALGIPSLLFGGALLWKLSYYGDIFPAPYYVKAAPESAGADLGAYFLERGAGYLVAYWRQYFLWALAGAAVFGARRAMRPGRRPVSPRAALLWTAAGMCALWHAYMIRTGGDRYEFRLLMPQAPMLMILAAGGLGGLSRHWRRAATVGALAFSLLHWQTAPSPIPLLKNHHLRKVDVQVLGGGRPDFNVAPGLALAQSRLLGLALWDLFGHLGKYSPEVRVAHTAGGLPAYLAPLLWTDMWGYADARIGKGSPEDVRSLPPGAGIGHFVVARPELLARIGVNLVSGTYRTMPEPVDFDRPLAPTDNPRLQWATVISHDFNLVPSEFPPDTQIFSLPLPDGQFTPMVYFNRNETIDRVLDGRGIERVNVF